MLLKPPSKGFGRLIPSYAPSLLNMVWEKNCEKPAAAHSSGSRRGPIWAQDGSDLGAIRV